MQNISPKHMFKTLLTMLIAYMQDLLPNAEFPQNQSLLTNAKKETIKELERAIKSLQKGLDEILLTNILMSSKN